MTNEELAVLIQKGDTEYVETLWNQCFKYITMKAYQWKRNQPETLPEAEDLIQSGFFALMGAVKYYNPDSGKSFIGLLDWYLNRAFRIEIGVLTTKRDASMYATSLDAPVGGDEDNSPLADFVEDPKAEAAIKAVDNELEAQHMREVLESVAQEILTPKRYSVFRVLLEGMSCDDSSDAGNAAKLGIATGAYRERKNVVFSRLRRNGRIQRLWADVQQLDALDDIHMRSIGVRRFRESGSSSVEHQALARIRREKAIQRRLKAILDECYWITPGSNS